jgi:hypothetical protein
MFWNKKEPVVSEFFTKEESVEKIVEIMDNYLSNWKKDDIIIYTRYSGQTQIITQYSMIYWNLETTLNNSYVLLKNVDESSKEERYIVMIPPYSELAEKLQNCNNFKKMRLLDLNIDDDYTFKKSYKFNELKMNLSIRNETAANRINKSILEDNYDGR